MLPASRYMGGVARSSDLRVIARSTGSQLERLRSDQSFCPDTDTPSVLERVPSRSRNVLIKDSVVAPSFVPQQSRSFHTSSPTPYDSTSYNVTDVPDFFVKYKQQRATPSDSQVHEGNHHESGLMHTLTKSILSGHVVATTRRLQAKIPVEHHAANGQVVHTSGFVVPGPGYTSTSDVPRAKERERNENLDLAMQTAAIARCVLESGDFETVNATTLASLHKIPFEVRERDGTIKHPSGFTPPTPAHKFRYTVNMVRDRKLPASRPKPRQSSPARAVLRAVHTSSSLQAANDS